MEYLDKNALLEDISLFAALSAEERAFICERSEIVEYRKGAVIYREGAPADAFYILIIGRVVIYTSDTSGRKTVLEYLHRGNYFGIISLLTAGAHSVTAEAINDCHFLMITKADFDSVIKRIPALAVHLSQTLSRRLKDKDIHQKVVFESTVIAVISSSERAGTSSYALNLALGLAQETKKKVVVVEMALGSRAHSLPGKLSLAGDGGELFLSAFDSSGQLYSAVHKTNFGIDCLCLRNAARDDIWIKRLVRALSLLVNDYHYVILDVPLEVDSPVLSLLHQSDSVHILTSPQEVYLRRTSYLVRRLTGEFGFAPGKIKVVINEYGASRLKPALQRRFLDHEIFATLPQEDAGGSERFVLDAPDSPYARVVRRIARDVGDCLVGLALGVGVAYGFCHIGVLKVIEEERIPIDVISGSSIGSVIASFWATGRSSGEILQIMKSEFKEPKYIWSIIDLTFPFMGFIKGNKLRRFLKKYFGAMTFQDVRLPLKIIATDVKRKEARVIDSGPLVEAIMASCTMPGVFMPFGRKDDILLDGGVINPLPTDVLFKMGIKKIIGVNVTPSHEDILCLQQKYAQEQAAAKKSWYLRSFLRNRLRTNILNIIFSSIELMQSELEKQEARFADVLLHPNVAGLFWLELHRAPELAARGEEETRRQLAKIKDLIKQ